MKKSSHIAWRLALCAVVLLLCARGTAALTIRAGAPESQWVVVIEPRFMRPEVFLAVPGSKKTILSAALIGEDGEAPTRLGFKELKELGVSAIDYIARARKNLDAVARGFKPEYIRDARDVIRYAVIRSENPLTASAVLAPAFAGLFADTLGPQVLVAVPNQHTIYVFPKLASGYGKMGIPIISDYKNSAYPVSMEVFEIANGTITAIGSYED